MTTQTEHPITRAELREELAHLLQHYATKADVAEVKVELAEVKAELKVELAGVKAAIAQMEVRLIRWTFGAIIAVPTIAAVLIRLTD